MLQIPFRADEYGMNFYIENDNGFVLVPYRTGEFCEQGMNFFVSESVENEVKRIDIQIQSETELPLKRLGLRLGIDTYMDTYPEWDNKYFPTALRCEKTGFWSCFMSPLGEIVSVCSPSEIVSWKNEYARADVDLQYRMVSWGLPRNPS